MILLIILIFIFVVIPVQTYNNIKEALDGKLYFIYRIDLIELFHQHKEVNLFHVKQ